MAHPHPEGGAAADNEEPHGGQPRSEGVGLPERLDEVTDSLSALHHSLDGQEPLDTVLSRLAQTAVRAIPDATVASVTLANGEQARTAASTSQAARAIEQHQRDNTNEIGPAGEASQQRWPVRAGTGEQDRHRWPGFAHAAADAGIAAYLSAPVYVDEPTRPAEQDQPAAKAELLGWLNLYSDSPDAFDPFDQALLRLLTTSISAAVTATRRQQRTQHLVDNLQHALTSRAEIDQAKGVLMAAHGIDADAAFTRLVTESQNTNTKLATVAQRLLASLSEH